MTVSVKSFLDKFKESKAFLIVCVFVLLLHIIGNVGCIIYSIIWYSRVSPWFGYAGETTSGIQTSLVPCFIFPIATIAIAILLQIRSKKGNSFEIKAYVIASLVAAFLMFVSLIVVIAKTSGSRCDEGYETKFKLDVVDDKLAFSSTVQNWKRSDKQSSFIKMMDDATDDLSIPEKKEYTENWYKKRCRNAHNTFSGYFSINLITFCLIVTYIVIDSIKPPTYRSLDVHFDNDELLPNQQQV